MGDAVFFRCFTPRTGLHPNTDRYGSNMRHRLRDDLNAIRKKIDLRIFWIHCAHSESALSEKVGLFILYRLEASRFFFGWGRKHRRARNCAAATELVRPTPQFS